MSSEKKQKKPMTKKEKKLNKIKQKEEQIQKLQLQLSEDNQDQEQEDPDINFNNLQEGNPEQIQVSFLIAEINQSYYHSLKTILLKYAQIIQSTNSEVADALVDNKKIGNVAIADDEEDEDQDDEEQNGYQDDQENVYSVTSILPSNNKLTKKVKELFLRSAQIKKIKEKVSKIIQNQQVSLLVNERLPNLPAFVAQNSHQVFVKDLSELKKTNLKLYEQLCSGYLFNVSEIQYQGSNELQNIIFSKFQDFQMCKKSKIWWIGENIVSHKKKVDLRKLFYIIKCEDYFKGVVNIKNYLE